MLLRALDIQTFTDEDLRIIQGESPPRDIVITLELALHYLRVMDISPTTRAYLRAETHAQELLERRDLEPHVYRHLERRGLVF